MRTNYLFYGLVCMVLGVVSCSKATQVPDNYLVLASESVENDADWQKVVTALQEKHRASVVYFQNSPADAMDRIRELNPRYVAVVDKPENIGRESVMRLHKLSRLVDDDIFADFLWGYITGYDAAAALKMVNNSTEPLVIKNAVATITEISSAKWFDRFGFVDDHVRGLWGEKKGPSEPVVKDTIAPGEVLRKFYDLYAEYDPDLVVTAAHATQRNLEMPFSLGNLKPKDGKLYADFKEAPEFLKESGKRKVYFACGNCLIGDVNHTSNSMAIAWMNGSNAATMIGYVVTTWHGRNGWGGLKYWLTTPGRYSLAEAVYLNQQDFLNQQYEWNPKMLTVEFPFDSTGISMKFGEARRNLQSIGIEEPTMDQIGFMHDRDVLAYYGDPKWDVRLQEIPEENDFTVKSEIKGKKCVITVTTRDDFDLKRMAGDDFKKEHVLDLPFSYFFPKRLKNPVLAEGQSWKAVVDENFLLIYDPGFEPGKTYSIVLDVE